jgi:hypothetical protein
MWDIYNEFLVVSMIENSNKLQIKTCFGRKNQLSNIFTLAGPPFNSRMNYFHI